MVARLVGLRARDVLLECQAYRERCVEEGKMAAYPPEGGGEPSSRRTRSISGSSSSSRPGTSSDRAIRWPCPTDEESLAAILARAIRDCSDEQAAGHAFEAEPDGRFVPVELHGSDDGVERILVGVCNKAAQGGALGRQVEELSRRAAEHTAVVVRSTAFPASPKAAITQLLNKLVAGGGRRVVVEDSDWRTMAALSAFRKAHADSPHYRAWCRQSRPLSSLQSLRAILGLDRPTARLPARPSPPPDPPPRGGGRQVPSPTVDRNPPARGRTGRTDQIPSPLVGEGQGGAAASRTEPARGPRLRPVACSSARPPIAARSR